MDRLRPRVRDAFSGFTEAEIEKMEKLCKKSGENSLNPGVYRKLAISFNKSNGRAGKPCVKWTEVQSWFQDKQKLNPTNVSTSPSPTPNKLSVAVPAEAPKNSQESKDVEAPKELSALLPCTSSITETPKISQESEVPDEKVSDLVDEQYEARSKTDGAWYDVYTVTKHKFLSSGETEVRIRFEGFGAEYNEWVNVKEVRRRSIPFEQWQCQNVKTGDEVLCFWEKDDEAKHYDARVMEIRRRVHDMRGCRCIFLIKFGHNSIEESVRLRRICRRG